MIGFWILVATAGLAAIAVIGAALLSGKGDDSATAAYDMQVYRDQLRELDRDVARGVIAEDEAGRAKVEISRRLLEADRKAQARAASGTAPKAATWAAIGASAALILGGGFWAYSDLGAPGYEDMTLESRIAQAAVTRETRPSQAEAEAGQPDWAGPSADVPADYLDLVVKLRAAVADHPDDLQGQSLLALHEGGLGNYRAAHAAQNRVIEIKGPAASADDFGQLAEFLVLAARGYVSPEAEAAVSRALTLNPDDPVALYYAGLMNAQIGRPDLGFRIWRDLLERSDPAAPWVPPILSEIGQLAARAGVDYTPPQFEPATSGPSMADIAAAEDMTAEDRADMIAGMVARLMDRLANEGGPASDWAKLIAALGVQGDSDRASVIWGEAQQVFAGRPDELALIDEAAAGAGLTEATPFDESAPGAGAPALAGPTAEDMNAAAEMSDADRSDMIESMVARLEDELLTDGGPPERWAQLFKVLGVLGDSDRAKSAWGAAQAAFADDPAGLEMVRAAAAAVGAVE